MKRFARILGALAAASLLTSTAVAETRDPATLDSREAQAIAQSLTVLRELQAIPDQRIPDLLLSKAEGIVILPANVKVGLIFGARFGNGVMLVRNEDRSWSNPVFVSTGGGSWGFQAGGQVSDIVLVLTTRESVEGITDGKLTLGADASVAAGPVGRAASAATDQNFTAEVYSYSRNRGLFAGVSIDGSIIAIDSKSNKRLYGKTAPAADIIAGTITTEADAANRFQRAILQSTGSQPAAAPALGNATSTPTETQPVATEDSTPQGAVTFPLEDSKPGSEPPR